MYVFTFEHIVLLLIFRYLHYDEKLFYVSYWIQIYLCDVLYIFIPWINCLIIVRDLNGKQCWITFMFLELNGGIYEYALFIHVSLALTHPLIYL